MDIKTWLWLLQYTQKPFSLTFWYTKITGYDVTREQLVTWKGINIEIETIHCNSIEVIKSKFAFK